MHPLRSWELRPPSAWTPQDGSSRRRSFDGSSLGSVGGARPGRAGWDDPTSVRGLPPRSRCAAGAGSPRRPTRARCPTTVSSERPEPPGGATGEERAGHLRARRRPRGGPSTVRSGIGLPGRRRPRRDRAPRRPGSRAPRRRGRSPSGGEPRRAAPPRRRSPPSARGAQPRRRGLCTFVCAESGAGPTAALTPPAREGPTSRQQRPPGRAQAAREHQSPNTKPPLPDQPRAGVRRGGGGERMASETSGWIRRGWSRSG